MVSWWSLFVVGLVCFGAGSCDWFLLFCVGRGCCVGCGCSIVWFSEVKSWISRFGRWLIVRSSVCVPGFVSVEKLSLVMFWEMSCRSDGIDESGLLFASFLFPLSRRGRGFLGFPRFPSGLLVFLWLFGVFVCRRVAFVWSELYHGRLSFPRHFREGSDSGVNEVLRDVFPHSCWNFELRVEVR